MEQPTIRPGHGVGPGAFAGAMAGVVLAVVRAVTAARAGGESWHPLEIASAPLLGPRALEPGFDATALVLGLVIHLALSVAWGAAFGLFFHGLSRRGTVIAGAFYGLVVWLLMFYVVLPLAGLSEVAATIATRTAIVDHVVFGLAIGIAYAPFQTRYAEYFGPPVPASDVA